MQRNSIEADKCVTCGRPPDWVPAQRHQAEPQGELEVFRGRELAPRDPPREVQPVAPNSRSYVQLCISFILVMLNVVVNMLWPVKFLRMDEQLRVQHLTTVTVVNGPGLVCINPFKTCAIVKALTLGPLDYVRVRDAMDGTERAVHGPRLFFLGPYEKMQASGQGVSVSNMQYVLIEDKQTGERKVQRGPLVWIPGPREEGKVCNAVRLSSTEYVTVEDLLSGARRVEKGPCIWFPGPYEEWEQGEAVHLSGTEYVTVQNVLSGERRVDKGPCMWFPGPHDQWTKGASTSLTCTQYLTVLNKLSGASSLVKGPCIWFPGPYDSASQVREAVVLQDDEYVKLKDISTGTRWVHRGKGLLFLEPTWRVESSNARSSGIQKSWALRDTRSTTDQTGHSWILTMSAGPGACAEVNRLHLSAGSTTSKLFWRETGRSAVLAAFAKQLAGAVGFLLGRTLLRQYVKENIVAKFAVFKAVAQAVKTEPFSVTCMVRFAPIPTTAKAMGLAAVEVPFGPFLLASSLFGAPWSILSAVVGSSLASLPEALLTSEYEQIVHENEMLRHGHLLPIQKAAFDLNGSRRPTKSTSYPYSVASQQTSQASQPVADNSGSVSSFMNICWKVDAGTVPSTPVTTIIKAPEGSACYPQPARAQPREDCSGLQTPCSSRSLPSRPHSEAMQHQVFRNSSDIKAMICEQIRQDESRKEAAEYYHTTGFIRQIARTSLFDQITMCMIALYAIYLAIDTDYNPDDVNTDPSSVFFWMDQFFCTFFFVELLLRFLSIKSKYKCFKDVWFVFDFFLVATMVLQTWLVPLIQLFVHQVSASLAADASVLRIARLLRLTRLLRMARLLRYMPELFILVKAIVAAMRSVVFTLALLMLLLYAFSIAFTQSLKGTECGRIYFNNVLLSMQSFFIFGTLLDEVWDLVSAMVAEKLWLALAGLYFFIIFSSITIMNMLIGVMCEVITAVAAAEKESLQVSWVKDTLRRVMGGSDVFVDQEEFYQILRDQ
ncbi:CACNA1H, partial [Symbiodinium sp. KB8]